MAGLPDFSLVCNSAKRATPEKKLPGDYYVAYKKLYDMCTPTTISEKNAVKQQRPSQKEKSSKRKHIDGYSCLEKKLQDIFLNSAETCNEKRRKTILKVMAETWEEYYSKAEEMDPSEYLSLVYEAIAYTGGYMIWKTKKDLVNQFRMRSMNARRTELVLMGVSRTVAEKYLHWQTRERGWFMFEDFPISVFENAPMWTDLEDTELLKFVCDQNGLFQDAVFVDWYCSINYEKLKKFHPEQLRHRFENKFSDQPAKIQQYMTEKEAKEQQQKAESLFAVQKEFRKRGIDLLQVVSFVNSGGFDCNKFECWIRLSKSMELETNVTLLRSLTRKHLMNGNPSTLLKVINSPGQDDFWFLLLEKHFQNLLSEIRNSVHRHFCEYQTWKKFEKKTVLLPNGDTACLNKVCVESICRILPLLTKSRLKEPLVGLDLFVFEIANEWKNINHKDGGRNPFILLEDFFLPTIRSTCLTKEEILAELDLDEQRPTDDNESVVIDNMPTYQCTKYSKRFCWRRLTQDEWMSIVEKAYLIGSIEEVNFRDPSTWLRILNASKVITGKSHVQIMELFFSEVFPNLNQYCGTEVFNGLKDILQRQNP